jgi:hypothetical protein
VDAVGDYLPVFVVWKLYVFILNGFLHPNTVIENRKRKVIKLMIAQTKVG